MCIYIYIYICNNNDNNNKCVCTYIYIYTHTEIVCGFAGWEEQPRSGALGTANPQPAS